MSIVAIHQPNYLPWPGWFSKMALSDIFVIFDDVQLPRGGHSYETRAFIRGGVGLIVPVEHRGSALIKDTRIAPGRWRDKHAKSLAIHYPPSSRLSQLIEIYQFPWRFLLDLNLAIIRLLVRWLGINTRILLSSSLGINSTGIAKLIGLIQAVGGDVYISGTGMGSRRYIHPDSLAPHGIKLAWHHYTGPNLSAIDSLLEVH